VKATVTWHSERVSDDVQFTRWGVFGQPVLIFPTAGGDSEEIERFLVIDCLGDLLRQHRIKVYSCDSVAGRALMTDDGQGVDPGEVQYMFQEYVTQEVVPAIRADCESDDIPIWVAGASIGAFNSLAMICRYPSLFKKALCMSGTFDMMRFHKARQPGQSFYESSPVHYLPFLKEEHKEQFADTFVMLASGEGKAEDIGESWRAADLLGKAGVPNRVESWGPKWDHDWPLWREMLPKYLGEWTAQG
jgi:esterase/lipase superfamily enzyme